MGCKWDSLWSPDSFTNYGGIQIPLGIPSLDSQAQHNPQRWKKSAMDSRVWPFGHAQASELNRARVQAGDVLIIN